MREPKVFRVKEALKECLHSPEQLAEFTHDQVTAVLALAKDEVKIVQAKHKALYKHLIHTISRKQSPFTHIQDTYNINIGKVKTALRVFIKDIDHSDPATLLDMSTQGLTNGKCNISDKQHRFSINLKLFDFQKKDGTKLRTLFVADWFVDLRLRKRGIGNQLHKIAETIAQENSCTIICSSLALANPENLIWLIAKHKQRGDELYEYKGKWVAKKMVK